mgnify:FL=1
MAQAAAQQVIMDTLTGLQQEVQHIKTDVHQIRELLEDTRLSEEEQKLVESCIDHAKAGNRSAFVSHEDLKKELRL